jgi:hypothetical protein
MRGLKYIEYIYRKQAPAYMKELISVGGKREQCITLGAINSCITAAALSIRLSLYTHGAILWKKYFEPAAPRPRPSGSLSQRIREGGAAVRPQHNKIRYPNLKVFLRLRCESVHRLHQLVARNSHRSDVSLLKVLSSSLQNSLLRLPPQDLLFLH